jgi:hypothetical protein
MATSLSQIEGFLQRKDLKFQRDADKDMILVPFKRGDNQPLLAVVKLEENGEFIKIFTPKLLTYLNGPNKLPLMQALLHVSWETKMLQWEYDPQDGEIRAIIEFPIEDSQLTERQFMRAFTGLLQLVEKYLPRLRSVIETGQDPSRRDEPGDDLSRAFRDFLEQRGGGGTPDVPDAL